jgi:hypothetical protein
MGSPPVFRTGANFDSADFGVQGKTGQKRPISLSFWHGVIQALARKGLLTQFDYLSTVSGGGYIGGWLTAFIHAHSHDVDKVQALLAEPMPPVELTTLRMYTPYMPPKPGFTSVDIGPTR